MLKKDRLVAAVSNRAEWILDFWQRHVLYGVEPEFFYKSPDPVLIRSANTCKEQTPERNGDRRSS